MNEISQGLKESKETVNLQDSRYYLNRELSWLHGETVLNLLTLASQYNFSRVLCHS